MAWSGAMKRVLIIVTGLSALVGILPILIGMTGAQGDELCDPEFYYAAERTCHVLADRAALLFGLYFSLAFVSFLPVALLVRFFVNRP